MTIEQVNEYKNTMSDLICAEWGEGTGTYSAESTAEGMITRWSVSNDITSIAITARFSNDRDSAEFRLMVTLQHQHDIRIYNQLHDTDDGPLDFLHEFLMEQEASYLKAIYDLICSQLGKVSK